MSAPDDRHPESGDASHPHFDFDDLVLDEEFIRSATINEASATARVERRRQQEIRRSSRFPRPQVRRVRRTFARWGASRPDDVRSRPAPDAPHLHEWTVAQWVVVVVCVVLAAAFVWSLTDFKSGSHHSSAAATAVITPVAPTATADCLLNAPGQTLTPMSTPVPCTTTHTAEVVGTYSSTSAPSATLTAALANSCSRAAQTYIGGKVPSGYQAELLDPASWKDGGTLDCVLIAGDQAGTPNPVSVSLRNRE